MKDNKVQQRQSVTRHLQRSEAMAGVVFCIILLSGCSLWGASSQQRTNKSSQSIQTTSLPNDTTGTLILQSGSSTWLFHANSSQPLQILGGQYISISPDGTLLLENGQQFVSTETGKIIGNVRGVTSAAGLQESLWLSSQEIVLGSYQAAGLYTAGLTSADPQVLSSNCSLGIYSPQAVNVAAKALLCLMDTGSLGIINYRTIPAHLTSILLHPPTQPQVAYLSYPAWAADGQHIVFVWGTSVGSTPPTSSSIVMTKVDGTAFTVLASASVGTFNTLPVWSPDGKQMVYVQENIGQDSSKATFAIHLLTLAAHHDRVLASGNGIGPSNIVWSPDGRYLAYDNIVGTNRPGAVTLLQLNSGHQYAIATGMTLVGWAV